MITCCGGWFVFHASVDCTAQISACSKPPPAFYLHKYGTVQTPLAASPDVKWP